MNRIGRLFRLLDFERGEGIAEDAVKQVDGELFTLKVSELRQQEGGFVAEEAVVADFAGEIGISALSPGLPATECHFSHRFDRRVVVTQRLHAEGVGNETQEICLTH